MRRVYFNGQILPETSARISVYDSALMFGDMVFEMTRSFNGVQFKLAEHIDRLYSGLNFFGIDPKITKDELAGACKIIQEINSNEPEFSDDDEHRLMINISRGPLSIYRDVSGVENRPTVVVTDFPLRWTVGGFGKYYDTGIAMATVQQCAIPHRYLDSKVKCRSRAHLMMANMQASRMAGSPWALLMDEHGYITEGTGDNFFMVKHGDIYTPVDRDCLCGISRQYIIDWEDVQKCDISEYAVSVADEAFITGTPFCILPVTMFNGRPIGSGRPGPRTMGLIQCWSNRVGVNIPEQIKKWDEQNSAPTGVSPYTFSGE